jgi:hypothetical protein
MVPRDISVKCGFMGMLGRQWVKEPIALAAKVLSATTAVGANVKGSFYVE